MSESIKLKRGLDIKLQGKSEKVLYSAPQSETYALKPTDFTGLTAKLLVKQGEKVKKGSPLFFDKYTPEIVFTAPVGGRVVSINRGERRKILEVVIQKEENAGAVIFKKADPLSLSGDQIKEQLLKSGLWPFIKRRPYGIIPNPGETPKAIFISMFDTAPLAPDFRFIIQPRESTFQTGLDALSRMTAGSIHLGVNNEEYGVAFKRVEVHRFSGPHPAGNVGIQIHHVSPVSKGDIIWTVNALDVLCIGYLFETGELDLSRMVALAGPEVERPAYYKTWLGTSIASLTEGKRKKGNNQRIISGNVLTGTKVSQNNFLGFYDSLVTVIPEGDAYEFMGWASPGIHKFSAGKTFLSSLFPKKEYILNANMHGGERAFVMSGQYEKFLPMNILPVFLLKAILVNDIDKMEQLGIYEIIEEDLALCEFACTSKIKVQDIVRKGIQSMIKELGSFNLE
jgi:Na+-transporting NADH:ubiquinone oxidoreductase subunit A